MTHSFTRIVSGFSIFVAVGFMAVVPAQATGTVFTFEDPSQYEITAFESAAASVVTNAETGFNGTHALKFTHGAGTSSGATIAKMSSPLITSGNTTITAMVYSPIAGRTMRMKVENQHNNGQSVEAMATASMVVGWQTLTFDFMNEAVGTAEFNSAFTYDMLSIFPGWATTASDVYFIDDITTSIETTGGNGGGGSQGPEASPTLITYESNDATGYLTTGFQGATASVENAPAGGRGGKALKIFRNGGQTYAGADLLNTAATYKKITSSSNKIVTMNFYSSVHSTIRVKVQLLDSQISKTVNAVYGWQKLTIDFGSTLDHDWADNPTYSNSFAYTRLEIFPNYGVLDSGVSYYVDDVAFNGATTPALAAAKLNQLVGETASSLKKGRSFTLPLRSSRGLALSWVTSTPKTCKVVSGKLVGLKAGVCTITGRNSGNARYKSVSVTRLLLIVR